MGKLVIRFKGKTVGEVDLKLGDTRIGRKPPCELVLDDPAVSGEHAIISTVGLNSTIKDLNSKNGVFVESKRIAQHQLKNGESILIGEHTLVYRDELNLDAPSPGARPAAPPPPPPARAKQETTTVLQSFAQLLAVEGANKGKRLPLVKEVNVLENPGKGPARVTRTSEGYLLEASVGPGEPRLNDKPVPPGGQLLANGDVIEVAGTKFQFYFK